MKEKALNKKLEHHCEYCVYGTCSDFSNEVLCLKRGITDRKDSCRRYKYDPLKRDPNRARISQNYSSEDFVLWFIKVIKFALLIIFGYFVIIFTYF